MRTVTWVPIRRATQKSDSSRFRVSGFGFRVLLIETNFRCRFRVSGFVAWNQLSLSVSGFGFFRVSGFGFRLALGKLSLQSRFRVSGFGFRSALGKVSLQSRFRVFGFRVSIRPGEVKSSESVSGFGFRSSKPTLTVGFGFRVSGFAGRNQLCRPLSGSRLRDVHVVEMPPLTEPHLRPFSKTSSVYLWEPRLHPEDRDQTWIRDLRGFQQGPSFSLPIL